MQAQDWASLYQQSVDAYNNYESAEARNLAERALTILRGENSGASKNEAVILRQLSIVCYDLGDDDGSVAYAKEEIEVLTSLGLDQDLNFASALQNLGVLRIYRSEYKAAEPLINQSLEITLTYNTNDSYEVGVLKGNLGVIKFHLKSDEEALILFQESLEVMDKYDEVTSDYYNIVYNYASLLSVKGRLEEALQYFQVLEEYYNFETPNFEYASILIKVGDVLDELGRYVQAVSKYQTAVENLKAIEETSSQEYSIALSNLSIDLQKTGQFDEAIAMMEELTRQSLDGASLTTSLTNYGNLLLQRGSVDLAKEKLLQVVDIYESDTVAADRVYVQALESMSDLMLREGNLQEASDYIDKGLTIAEEIALGDKMYTLFNQQAKVYISEAKYSKAKEIAEKSYSQVEQLFGAAAVQTAYVRNTLAGIYTQLGQYDDAEQHYLAILPVFRKSFGESHPEYATVAANYSSLLQLKGSFYTAEYYLKIAEEIKRKAYGEENLDYLTTYENLALLYLNTARYTESSAILQNILSLKIRLLESSDPLVAYTYMNLGIVKKQLAEYADAEEFLKSAVSIYEKSYGKGHVYYASAVNNLALLYQKMGNLEASKPLFEQAMVIYEKQIGQMSPDYATALENLATLYQLEGDLVKAKSLLEEALLIDEQILGVDHPLYSKTLHNLAAIYEENGEYEKARELYGKALGIEQRVYGENHPAYASTLYNLAVLEQEQENYDKAKEYYQKVVDIRKATLGVNHPDFAYSQYGLASAMHKTGFFEEAKPLYLEVTNQYLDFVDKYFPALSETEKAAFYGKIKPVFDSYLDFVSEYVLLNKGSESDRQELIGSMFDLQLSTKALLLNASNKVRNTILSSGDKGLIDLFNNWIALKEEIVKAYSMSKEELEASGKTINQMETEANNLEKDLSLKSTVFAGTFDQERPTWNAIQSKLEDGQLALEVIRIKKKMKKDSVLYIGMILSPNESPRMIVKGNGVEMEDKGFKSYKNSIMYKLEDLKSYDIFWREFDVAIPDGTTSLYLSADGVLNKVNISTLYDSEKGEYLVDKYKVRLLSNTRELIEDSDAADLNDDAVMFGFPKYHLSDTEMVASSNLMASADMERGFGSEITELPGTLAEVQEIQKVISGGSWNVKSYLGADATETEVKSVKGPKVLHIATHGFFLEDIKTKEDEGLTSRNARYNPLLRSGLLLAGAQNTVKNEDLPGDEDGILTAYEVMNLNLDNTELVVMSACETGLGEVKNGEGVYGLQRSFIVAGADNLVMSLWKVNDQTTQLLMTGFYQNWFSGQSKLDAFNNAISAVRAEYKEPYYWGAFVILGK
ncbi:MAG: hypothetical protein CMB80_13570 [Flammeovirgaceae bacterium]|nr:hypothetical protein [Flammeovirgaceae bacterium]HCX24324.1 hypothetical protein [Cytophagales bacterium]